MNEDFNLKELHSNFDIKEFIFKVFGFWKMFLLSLAIAFAIAYSTNIRKQNIYALDSLISVENDQNPFFTSTTSISFNWGGVTSKVQTVITTLKTRSHNEKVIDSLQYYIQYLTEGKYRKNDIYKTAPFVVTIDKSKPQVLGHPITIKFINDDTFEMFSNFESDRVQGQIYDTKEKIGISFSQGQYSKTFSLGETIENPFFNGTVNNRSNTTIQIGKEYLINFLNFDNIVNHYKNGISVKSFPNGSSVLTLRLIGSNKSKIVDYLNTTVSILKSTQLDRKNLYATNTIKFIDSTLNAVTDNLRDVENEMNSFRSQNKIFNIDEESSRISDRLREYQVQKTEIDSKSEYLSSLQTYLETKTEYINIAAPTSVGIEESSIVTSVQRIIDLSITRQKLEYTTRETSSQFRNIDRQIDAEKNVLLETLKETKKTFGRQLNSLNGTITTFESKLSKLPKDQQDFLKIQRKFNLSEAVYNTFQAKKSEAEIVKAANVSDINVIDEAKDIGGGLIGPNKRLNYLIAIFSGILIPLMIIIIITFLDNNIHTVTDIEGLSKISNLGVIGKYKSEGSLAVYDNPKSAIAESFRAIRSSLKFIYKTHDIKGTKTLLITSSVSGEGKTFCAINIASVFALTKKRTVLVGLDLRKPKISKDFNVKNDIGVVDYLIGTKNLDDISQATHIDDLDVIVSGSVPPNPSELLMGAKMDSFIADLKTHYDIIVLDSPPLGLVTDAIELVDYADATIYIIRQNYTKKDMLSLINDKYKKGVMKNVSFVLNYYTHKKRQGYGYGYG
ncbi:MAG: sugar transporter, partial [Bacteroidetes bacterium]